MSAFAVVMVIFVLGLMATVVVRMTALMQTMRADHLDYEKAFYVNHAGIEYGVRKIYEAASPVVNSPGITFGPGTFTIAQQGRTVTVTATVGTAQVVHTVQSPTMADCTTLNTVTASWVNSGKRLSQVTVTKNCLIQVVLDKIIFSWTPNNGTPQNPETVNEVKIENSVLYNDPAVPAGTLMELADYTMTTNGNNVMNRVDFQQVMTGKTVTMTTYFTDLSTKSATFTPDD